MFGKVFTNDNNKRRGRFSPGCPYAFLLTSNVYKNLRSAYRWYLVHFGLSVMNTSYRSIYYNLLNGCSLESYDAIMSWGREIGRMECSKDFSNKERFAQI